MADPEIAVVGAGIIGLSTAYELKSQGHAVAIYEAAAPGSGQSAAESRLFRHGHDDPRLVQIAKASRHGWKEWEKRFGAELVSRDGAVALGELALERLRIMDRVGGLRAREAAPAEVSACMPALAQFDGPAVIDPDAGAIRTGAAISMLASAVNGSLRRELGEVISLDASADRVVVRAVGGTREHRHVVVCAGRGTSRLISEFVPGIAVQNSTHVRLEFAVREPGLTLACFQDSSGQWSERGVYGAPLPGCARYAVGLSETTDHTGEPEASQLGQLANRTRRYVSRALPGLDPEPVGQLHCWVTTLPWSDDGLAVWQQGSVTWVIGHNLFKFAPELGRTLAQAAVVGDLADQWMAESTLGSPA